MKMYNQTKRTGIFKFFLYTELKKRINVNPAVNFLVDLIG
jgi:hypothetical protein